MRTKSLIAAVLLAILNAPVTKAQMPQPRLGELNAGDRAPDFTLQDVEGKQTVKLSGLKGKPVILIFGSCT